MLNNLLGKRFERLTVIGRAPNVPGHKANWRCICDCGNECVVRGGDLVQGKTKSCGCIRRETAAKNGRIGSFTQEQKRLSRIHRTMLSRCNNPKNIAYSCYGGRGIAICKEWEKLNVFIEWAISNGYKESLTIDRINNNFGYFPSNCRWATYKEQENNRTNNRVIDYFGEQLTLSQLAEKLGLSAAALAWRIQNGWTMDEWGVPTNLANKWRHKNA